MLLLPHRTSALPSLRSARACICRAKLFRPQLLVSSIRAPAIVGTTGLSHKKILSLTLPQLSVLTSAHVICTPRIHRRTSLRTGLRWCPTHEARCYREDVHESEDDGQNCGSCNFSSANPCQLRSDSSNGTTSGSTLNCSRISLRNELLLVLDRIPYRDRLNKSLLPRLRFSI